MITVHFGREKYHRQSEMLDWCILNLATPVTARSYWAVDAAIYHPTLDWSTIGDWCIGAIFGHTYFHFKNAEDAVWFKLVWA